MVRWAERVSALGGEAGCLVGAGGGECTGGAVELWMVGLR